MKIYTRTGDDGTTGTFGGDRVMKHHPRIEACGTVDETNATLGAVIALIPPLGSLSSLLASVQHDLFDLGADIATPLGSRAKVSRISQEHVTRLEKAIDVHETDLVPLKRFILPGGTHEAAMLHLARTVCRRAERCLTLGLETEDFNEYALQYLNRLSDLLFVLARWANFKAGETDVPWEPHTAGGR